MIEVIILGHGPTNIQCDYHCETFGINNTYSFARRLDKLFVFDPISTIEFNFDQLKQVPCIVTTLAYPQFSNIEVYPIKEILRKFRTTFFSNGVCYMIAYALYKEYEKIFFYGIDMMTTNTYMFEKGGVEYWMGIAHAMGVPIINTKESATGKTIDGKMYGYWGPQFENISTFNQTTAAECKRLIKSFQEGLSGRTQFENDPDGHLGKKWEAIRAGAK